MNVEIEADNCVPTAGSMQASLATFWLVSQLHLKRKKILFLDPSFSTQMQQCRLLGIEFERVDVFDAKPRNVVGLVRAFGHRRIRRSLVFQPFKPGLELSNPRRAARPRGPVR